MVTIVKANGVLGGSVRYQLGILSRLLKVYEEHICEANPYDPPLAADIVRTVRRWVDESIMDAPRKDPPKAVIRVLDAERLAAFEFDLRAQGNYELWVSWVRKLGVKR